MGVSYFSSACHWQLVSEVWIEHWGRGRRSSGRVVVFYCRFSIHVGHIHNLNNARWFLTGTIVQLLLCN